MNEFTVCLENLSKEEQAQLLELIAKSRHTRWRADKGEGYKFLSDDGEILTATEVRAEEDNHRYNSGNYFKDLTEAEAAFAFEKAYVLQELKDIAALYNKESIDWKKNKDKYCIWYNHSQDTFGVDSYTVCEFPNMVYFASEKGAWAAIETIGKLRLKKYLFGRDV